ncbi:TPA: phage tail assembly chaperone [Photobacterium damselae]
MNMTTEGNSYGRPVSEVISEQKWDQIRNIRDSRLKACDFIVIKSNEMGQQVPDKWKVYRQTLRDIPQTYDNPDDIVWPAKPTL